MRELLTNVGLGVAFVLVVYLLGATTPVFGATTFCCVEYVGGTPVAGQVEIAQDGVTSEWGTLTPVPTATLVSTATPIPAVSTATPAPTETPQPASTLVATATPRATDTPIPAPTAFPTCALDAPLGGTGSQGIKCEPTLTPAATATLVSTATPRPTDTPAPAATREAQGFSFSTATPVAGCIESAVSSSQLDCVAPGTAITPAPTSTVIPPVATATPRATDTPIPAPTAAPTCAVGIFVEGTGNQGVQCGAAALTTATPIAAGFLYDSAGGAGSVVSYVTAVPTATIIATATPRATDTPIPTPTAIGSAGKVKNCGIGTYGGNSTTVAAGVTTFASFGGYAISTVPFSTTETSRLGAAPVAMTVTDLAVDTTTAQSSTGTLAVSVDDTTAGTNAVFVTVATNAVAGVYRGSGTLAVSAGDLLAIKLVQGTLASANIRSINACWTIP